MGTMCYIGMLENNKVRYITCHWDGYLSYAGVILQLGYASAEKVNALLNLGDISAIGYNIETPKQFKNIDELERQHIYYNAHFKTTFVIAYRRDMNYNANYTAARVCTLQEFCADAYYGYIYDVVKKCWFVTVNGCKPVNLKKVLTDKEIFTQIKNKTDCSDNWQSVVEYYNDYKADLSCKGTRSIIGQYNCWLSQEPLGRGLTFDYVVRDGKRVYALLPKAKEPNKQRKPLMCSEYIGDLVQYIFDGKARQ